MNCEKCDVELNEETKCCDGGTSCKACCECKEEETKKEDECCGDCHCS
ncbi:hypothetical protein KJ785_04820 [Patescibacteria group bacterium]|nr:hypothetical protein [Patescibacteria group bacterium]